jgi:hypothetical protein
MPVVVFPMIPGGQVFDVCARIILIIMVSRRPDVVVLIRAGVIAPSAGGWGFVEIARIMIAHGSFLL